jgi:shikimate dehydrogenase
VNNVVRTDAGRLIGFNSDAPGFRAGVERALGGRLAGLDVLVAGAGGAARAVVFACLAANVGRVTVAARDAERARALLAPWSAIGRAGRRARSLDGPEIDAALGEVDLVVNATTVGMIDPGVPFPVEPLRDDATVFDCVYVPAETPLVAAARARGLRAANGSEMLIAQAAIAFERWTGVGGMADVMREAVAPLLADAAVTA